jgi:hypothetical protein
MVVVINGVQNPHQGEVAKDITESIIRERAEKGKPATYWNKEEQEARLVSAFEKWSKKGGVWSAAAPKVNLLA